MSIPLPTFQPRKKDTGIVTEYRSESDSEENMGLMAAATELLKAVEAKDAKGVALALQSAFELLDSQEPEAQE